MKISPGATIADITHLLADGEEYVRRIMENMMSGPYDRDDAVVRIGVSGTGIAPNYRIEYPNQPELTMTALGMALLLFFWLLLHGLGFVTARGRTLSSG